MESYWLGPNNEVSQVPTNNDSSSPVNDDEDFNSNTRSEEVTSSVATSTILMDRQQNQQHHHQSNNHHNHDSPQSNNNNNDQREDMISESPTKFNSYLDNVLKSNFMTNLIVSYWDNNMGPRPLKIWNGTVPRSEILTDDTLLFISRFSMMDDMPRYEEIGPNIEIKFNIMSDLNVMVLTAVFCSKNWEKGTSRSFFRRKVDPPPTLFTISIVMNRENLSKFMVINFIMKEKLITLAKIMKHFADQYTNSNQNEVVSNFENHLHEFVQLYDSLSRIVYSPPSMNLYTTLFSEEISLKRLYESEEESIFLQRAISSHLETHGYSVVVGLPNQLREINVWVNTLAMFLSQHEKQLIKHAKKIEATKLPTEIQTVVKTSFFKRASAPVKMLDPENLFKPEIFVQGLVVTPDVSHWKDLIPTKSLLSGRYPISVIDLKDRKVYSFKKYQYFQAFKQEFFEESESKNILNDFGIQNTGNDKQFRDHYEEARRICTSVQELFYVILKVMPLTIYPSMRYSLISEFVRLLNRKALALAKYVHSMRNVEMIAPAKIQKVLVKHVMINNSVQKYRPDDLTSELMAITATAEKLQHGVYTIVTGDPRQEAEDVVNFLGSTNF